MNITNLLHAHHAEILLVFGTALLLLCLCSIRARLKAGARLRELAHWGWHEITPVRALLRTVQAVLWGVAALAALRALGHLLGGFNDGWGRHAMALLLHFMSTAVLAGAACWWQAMLMNKGRNPPVPVAVQQVETGSQIDAESLGTLGCERFPNFISETWQQEAAARKKLLAGCAALALWCLLEACEQLKAGPGALLAWAAPLTGWLPHLVGLLLLWCSAALLGVLLVSNRDYRLTPFDRVVRQMALAVLGATAGLAVLRPEAREAAKWLGWGFAALTSNLSSSVT